MGPVNWDDLDRFNQKVHNHGRAIRMLAVTVILVSIGLICSNIGNIIGAFGRIF